MERVGDKRDKKKNRSDPNFIRLKRLSFKM